MVVNWLLDGKPDVSMAANGLLAGLVSITAPVGAVSTQNAVIIGAIGGRLVVFAVTFFDRLRVDDPVGAISVHGICGTWGTLSIAPVRPVRRRVPRPGGRRTLLRRRPRPDVDPADVRRHATSCSSPARRACCSSLIKQTIGLRVTEEEEIAGLDIEEHGAPGYGPDILGAGTPTLGTTTSAAPAHG